MSCVFAAVILAGAIVVAADSGAPDAARKRALELYEDATRRYNLGEFEKAIEIYKQAYETHPASEFLFNIAQAYRQLDNCEKALFFYRRFLSVNPSFAQRKEVEERIVDLERRCEEKKVVQEKPPEGTRSAPSLQVAATPPARAAAIATATVAPASDRRGVEVDVAFGAGVQRFGEADVPIGASIRAGAGLAFALGSAWSLRPGLGVSFARVPYRYMRSDRSAEGTMNMTALFAELGVDARALKMVSVGAAAGAGVLILSGLDQENQFTRDAAPASGAIVLPVLNARLLAALEVGAGFSVLFSPIGVTIAPGNDRLREGTSAVVRADFMLGGRYAF